MDITQAIEQLVPKAKYGGYPRDREHFDNLRWEDERAKPAWDDIEPLLAQKAPEPERPPTTTELWSIMKAKGIASDQDRVKR